MKSKKSLSRKTSKLKASIKKISKKTNSSAAISPNEVAALESAASLQKNSERTWLNMTSASADDSDGWSVIEEHLLDRNQKKNHSERRWKYFSK